MGLSFTEPKMPLVMRSSLLSIGSTFSLRCDAKQGQARFLEFDKYISKAPFFELGEYLPNPLIKGSQPDYLEDIDSAGVPVINTLSIQNLQINTGDCRLISEEDYEALDNERKCCENDILLTVDGGTSIGKAVLFNLEGPYTVDSHVTILRPENIDPLVVVYLLASPLGQLQFQRAESGASGQTAVTEDDIRRFRFPLRDKQDFETKVLKIDTARKQIELQKKALDEQLKDAWLDFSDGLLNNADVPKRSTAVRVAPKKPALKRSFLKTAEPKKQPVVGAAKRVVKPAPKKAAKKTAKKASK